PARHPAAARDLVGSRDVVITTALIGGVFAPKIITAEMVRSMRPGSIIVDLAADGGGNCEVAVPGQDIEVAGVRVMAPLNLPATMPEHASLLFSRNLTNFVEAFSNEGEFEIDTDDEIQAGCLITKDGDVVHDGTRDALHALATEATS
ncbi:MAG: NAD(P)(+) transhydrogenase (Re/Si-specific) subunit alpha, partial [Gammaproteobacteria bacterium]|nr:NAD(P)(+) transhydrogenase (Re/Si-specific) subunit alpha [Gammaproteobacteria bacterium]